MGISLITPFPLHLLAFRFDLGVERHFQVVEHVGDVGRILARGQLVDRAERPADQPALVHLLQAGPHVVIDEPPHPAQFPHRVEVADQRHPRVHLLAVALLLVEVLGGGQQGDVDPDQGDLEPASRGTETDIAATRYVLARGPLEGEEVVLHVEAVGREDADLPQERGVDLVAGLADCGGGGDQLRANRLAVHFPRAQLVHGRLVQPDECPQRPRDQVQLVLDDQVGGTQQRVWCRLGRGVLVLLGM